MSVFFGDDNRTAGVANIPATRGFAHPSYSGDTNDIGVVILSAAGPAAAPPVPINRTPLNMSMVGKRARIVGFGRNAINVMSGDHVKQQGTGTFDRFDGNWIHFPAGTNGEHECLGDSGGPALLDLGCGESIIGEVSYHDDNACESGFYQRVDIEQSFIDMYVRMADPGYVAPPCTADRDGGGGAGSSGTSSGSAMPSGSAGAGSTTSSGAASAGQAGGGESSGGNAESGASHDAGGISEAAPLEEASPPAVGHGSGQGSAQSSGRGSASPGGGGLDSMRPDGAPPAPNGADAGSAAAGGCACRSAAGVGKEDRPGGLALVAGSWLVVLRLQRRRRLALRSAPFGHACTASSGGASQAAIACVQGVMARRDESGGHAAGEGLVDQEARQRMARFTQRSRPGGSANRGRRTASEWPSRS
jgi:hypothetical protein